ncbi:MAG: UDP-N-acetylmuramate--L-alanine ligase, partial [Acidobacteria bacterium]|nr:UDP-N-acetylmuramate--L-alanine ligase [Acidobacteriota bacterium]
MEMDAPFDLSVPRRVHVVGAGGAAMSAIAQILAAMGHAVSGSDAASSKVLDRLVGAGVDVHVGHDPAWVQGADIVVASTAVPVTDPELAAATDAGATVLRRPDAMAALCRSRRTIGVAGAHGKTTTSAMLATVLRAGGLDPSFIVGGAVLGLDTGAHWGDGEWFVVEADESDGTFLRIGAEAVIVTNVEPDHLDHWGTFDALREGYRAFLAGARGPRVVCADDPATAALASELGGCVTYGTAA